MDVKTESTGVAKPEFVAKPQTRQTAAPRAETDEAINAELDRGDVKAALVTIDSAYGDAVYRFVLGMMGARDRADDVYQTTLVQVYRDLDRFERRSSVRAWVFAIARNRCLDALKSNRRRHLRIVAFDHAAEAADASPDPATRLDDAQLARRLEHCIDELPADARTAVLLRYQENMRYEQISKICGEKPATIRARVSRAMPALRRCIEEAGVL